MGTAVAILGIVLLSVVVAKFAQNARIHAKLDQIDQWRVAHPYNFHRRKAGAAAGNGSRCDSGSVKKGNVI